MSDYRKQTGGGNTDLWSLTVFPLKAENVALLSLVILREFAIPHQILLSQDGLGDVQSFFTGVVSSFPDEYSKNRRKTALPPWGISETLVCQHALFIVKQSYQHEHISMNIYMRKSNVNSVI